MFSRASKSRLTDRDIGRFPDATLFHRIARAVCRAGCLPRKELYEAWEMARRVRRLFRGGRVVDLAGGHGLLAQVMLIADRSSPSAVVVDTVLPVSSRRVHVALAECWPELEGRARRLRGGGDRRGTTRGQRCHRLMPRLRDAHRPSAAARGGCTSPSGGVVVLSRPRLQ